MTSGSHTSILPAVVGGAAPPRPPGPSASSSSSLAVRGGGSRSSGRWSQSVSPTVRRQPMWLAGLLGRPHPSRCCCTGDVARSRSSRASSSCCPAPLPPPSMTPCWTGKIEEALASAALSSQRVPHLGQRAVVTGASSSPLLQLLHPDRDLPRCADLPLLRDCCTWKSSWNAGRGGEHATLGQVTQQSGRDSAEELTYRVCG